MTLRLLYLVNSSSYFLSHRREIAIAARKSGFEIHVASPSDSEASNLEDYGFIHHSIPISRTSMNIYSELRLIFKIVKVMREVKPDISHLITIKPVVYGGIISKFIKMSGVISAIPGLGYTFINQDITTKILRTIISFLYRLSFSRESLSVIFQNEDDRRKLIKLTKIDASKTVLIKGSGVDLDRFSMKPFPQGKPMVTMISRIQKDKGVLEFVEAAKILREKGNKAQFQLAGDHDTNYPSSISEKEINLWREEGIIDLLGYRKDINFLLENSHLVILPSYREGLPKVLLEAAASGRPVITSNVPGCRDAIKENITGILVPVNDPKALANKIEFLLDNRDLLKKMGKAARMLAEKEFSIEKVVNKHLDQYKAFTGLEK